MVGVLAHRREPTALGVSAEPPGERMPTIYRPKSLRVPSARRLPEAIA